MVMWLSASRKVISRPAKFRVVGSNAIWPSIVEIISAVSVRYLALKMY
jgi:hypothetical protein